MARLRNFIWITSLCLLAFIVSASPQGLLSTSFTPHILMPDDDPFYSPPPGFTKARPGSILRYRLVPNPITIDNTAPIQLAAAWQLLYRTINSVGGPEANVVTLLVPFKARKNNLFVYHQFSDAAYNACNPSMTLQIGTRSDNLFNQAQNNLVVEGLSRGYYVSVADDGGPQAAFAASLQAAYASLDSIRAVKQSGNFSGIGRDPIVTLYGYSGGGGSAAWTTEIQPNYAPDVKIAGAAVGGLIPNATAVLMGYNSKERASFIPPAVFGLAHDYKNMSDWLDEALLPEKAAEFRMAEKQCFDSNAMYSFQDLAIYFKRGFKSLVEPVPFSVWEWATVMGLRDTPRIPWYLYESIWDDASPIKYTDDLVEKYCKNGATIHYERNDILELTHSNECIWGLAGAFQWLADRHDSKPLETKCTVSSISKESTEALIELRLFRGLFNSFTAYLGIPINSLRTKVNNSVQEKPLKHKFKYLEYRAYATPGDAPE